MTVARLGPTSTIRRKKSRNPSAEQTTPRTITEARASSDGVCAGKSAIAEREQHDRGDGHGGGNRAERSAPESLRFTIIGPIA